MDKNYTNYWKTTLIICSACFLTHINCLAGGSSDENYDNDTAAILCYIDQNVCVDDVIDYATTYVGTPYHYGGTTPKGFDCSGFLQYVFAEYGLELARSSSYQSKIGDKIKKQELQKGDFIFFKSRNLKSKRVGHVALVTDVDGTCIQILHATNRGIVRDDLNTSSYYKKRYLFARRIFGVEEF